MAPNKACVIGAGAWGTALAIVLSDKGYKVSLWARSNLLVQEINEKRRTPKLFGIPIPQSIEATTHPEEALEDAKIVVSAVPSTAVRSVADLFGPLLAQDTVLISATKGLDPETFKRPSEIWIEKVPLIARQTVVVSGPNFALEIARRLPAATVVAGEDKPAKIAQAALITPYLRVYTNQDRAGVEFGGAFKNIIAISSGMAEGANLGFNCQAAIISRGIAEIARLGTALGAQGKTFAGLSGLGDLVLSSTGHLSRNRQAGIAVGRGESIESFLGRTGYTVEGVNTVKSVMTLSKMHEVPMPISHVVQRILFMGTSVRQGLYEVMSRERRSEDWN